MARIPCINARFFLALYVLPVVCHSNQHLCRYVGTWHQCNDHWNISVWVATRENPHVADPNGILTMRADGNLVNVSAPSNSNSISVIENSGNLVVSEASSGAFLWESFDHPSDTLLPGMKIGVDLKTGKNRTLTAGKTDPAPEIYSFGIDTQDPNQFFFWREWCRNRGGCAGSNLTVVQTQDETLIPFPGDLGHVNAEHLVSVGQAAAAMTTMIPSASACRSSSLRAVQTGIQGIGNMGALGPRSCNAELRIFHCNSSNGLLYFQAPDGSSYAISSIDPETRTFVIKPQARLAHAIVTYKKEEHHLYLYLIVSVRVPE
ncbi:hypothetical protein ACLOJK_039735 [Asimina triloba]